MMNLRVLMLLLLISATALGETRVTADEISSELSICRAGESEFRQQTVARLADGDRLRTSVSGAARVRFGEIVILVGPGTELSIGARGVKLIAGRLRVVAESRSDFELVVGSLSMRPGGTELVSHLPVGRSAGEDEPDRIAVPLERTYSLGVEPGETRVAVLSGTLKVRQQKSLLAGDTLSVGKDGRLNVNRADFSFQETPRNGRARLRVGSKQIWLRYRN